MLLTLEAADVPAQFAEMLATIEAGYGVIITRTGEPIARLVPESAFHKDETDQLEDGLTPEEREAREVMSAFEAMMNDSF
jgi:antitoxin (DNA-binding transcriptional repressor) of toxin-antitoxin stability system